MPVPRVASATFRSGAALGGLAATAYSADALVGNAISVAIPFAAQSITISQFLVTTQGALPLRLLCYHTPVPTPLANGAAWVAANEEANLIDIVDLVAPVSIGGRHLHRLAAPVLLVPADPTAALTLRLIAASGASLSGTAGRYHLTAYAD